MRIGDAIKMIMKDMHVNQSELARRTGLFRQAVYYRLREMGKTRGKKYSLGVDALVQLANGLNYKVVLLPKTAQVSDGGYVVSEEESTGTGVAAENYHSRNVDELMSLDLRSMMVEVIVSGRNVSNKLDLLQQEHHDLFSRITKLESDLVKPAVH